MSREANDPGRTAGDQLPGVAEQRPRLLMVDDQPVNVQALYQVFAADHQVFMATGGEQALRLCAEKRPDLVLLDLEMPGVDGYEVCRRLKADPELSDIPVIFITGHNDEAAETQGLDVGAVDFISKPFNPRIVRARVRTQLTLKAQADLLRHWVYIDGLTGVHNRRHFDQRIAAELGRAQRVRSPLSVILLDIDFFKRFNDRYGHQAGDHCLRRVAVALQAAMRRPTDLMARYGGEEFVGLLPDTDLDGALTVAQSLLDQVLALQIPHEDSDVGPWVSVSLGVACLAPGWRASAEELLEAADAQLYDAKHLGRKLFCGMTLGPDAPA